MHSKELSVVIPVLNEEGNIGELIDRLDHTLAEHQVTYELIFVDDHSTDGTRQRIQERSERYPVFLFLKEGERGKAQSLIEGFRHARYANIAMLDADLQYPPEALPGMLEKLEQGSDIVVARREQPDTHWLRRLLSRGFAFFFSKFLHGLDCDVQAGLKLFRRRIVQEVRLDPSPWTFDLEFLLSARNYGYVIGNYAIHFAPRKAGNSKLNVSRAILEIGWNALKLRFKPRAPLHVHPSSLGMVGAGVAHGRLRFVTHTTLHHSVSALHTFAPWQKMAFLFLLLGLAVGLWQAPLQTGIVAVGCMTLLYFLDTVFNLHISLRSLARPPEIVSTEEELRQLDESRLPVYSILSPLYKEAHMLPGFLDAMDKLDWPKNKLDVLLLLEEDDAQTIEAAEQLRLPPHVRMIVVPHSQPKTKPKACNYGLSLARGEYVVIYDAEDMPDPLQLKKAYLGFQKSPDDVWCLQAKLNYFNPYQNLLTRMFTAEYSLWFDVILPGLQSINTAIPLGGTSNHFRRKNLLELKGWDPFNVTEDCDLGVRMFKWGYRTAIIDSVTLEEANSNVKNWIRQRSRWIKGYMQTYLVHMRHPLHFVRENGWHALLFQLVVGGKIIFMLVNPLLWMLTIGYFTLYMYVGETIEALYPSLIFYMAVVSLVFGNFLYMYYYMIGCAKRGHWPLLKYALLVPFLYWPLVSVAALMAAWQLFLKPHYWEKTHHGLHLKKKKRVMDVFRRPIQQPSSLAPALSPARSFSVQRLSRLSARLSGLSGLSQKYRQAIPTSLRVVRPVPISPSPAIALHADPHVAEPKHVPFSNRVEQWITFQDLPGLKYISNLWVLLAREARSLWTFLFSSKGIFLAGLLLANFINFLFNAFLGRVLSLEAFGLVTFVNTLWYCAMIFLGAYSSTVNHTAAYTEGARIKHLGQWLRHLLSRGLVVMQFVSLAWLILVPWLALFFKVDALILYLFTPIFLFGFLVSTGQGYTQGRLRFPITAAIYVGEALFRLGLAAGFVAAGKTEWVYLAIPFSIVLSGLLALLLVRRDLSGTVPSKPLPRKLLPAHFYTAALVGSIGTLMFLNVDVLLIKHYLDPVLVGQYALLALVGKMIFFLGGLPASLLVALTSRAEGAKKSSRSVFHKIYTLTILTVLGMIAGLFVLGDPLVPWLLGEKTRPILTYLPLYATALGFFTLTGVVSAYHMARREYIFSLLPCLSAFLMAGSIILFHDDLQSIVLGIFWSALGGWVAIQLMDFFESQVRLLHRGVRDLLDIFGSLPVARATEGGYRRILIFNWRDRRHKFAGGAEEYVHEVAKEWVRQGHQVTLFCGNDGESPRRSKSDGIDIVRRGGFYLVYMWAFLYYIFRFRGNYDVIIDCQNGVPFFTPLYTRRPVYCLMHHVHQSVFLRDLIKPLALFASFLEKDMMPWVYRNVRFITVSASSREEMVELGLGQAGIDIIHPGVHLEQLGQASGGKTDRPTVLYLGRLKAYKSIDVLIRAFARVTERLPEARLVIAGSGEEERNLRRVAATLGLGNDQVEFSGHVSDKEKVSLLQRAWVLVNPSYMEGWGIVAIEANACGTPVIASNVPGLRDSVRNPHTGFLVSYGDEEAFADRILEVLQNKNLRDSMGEEGKRWAAGFDWRESGQLFLAVLESKEYSG